MTVFEPLSTCCKTAFPFRVSVPSYIYPADWVTNVRLLAPYVDEIELMLLESHSESCFPSKAQIRDMIRISQDQSLSFNVHLPSDISLSDPVGFRRDEAVETFNRVISMTAALSPSTWTLHLPFDRAEKTPEALAEWRTSNQDSLLKLIAKSKIPSRALSIETLFYPFDWIGDTIRALDLSVCLDTGHLMIVDENISKIYEQYADRTAIVHLHGVRDPDETDHESLHFLSPERSKTVLRLLRQYHGVVSVEVFAFKKLSTSLKWLSDQW